MNARRESLVRGLLDPAFTRVVTPRLAGWLYVVAAVGIALWTLAVLAFIWGLTTWAGAGWWWYAPPVAFSGLATILAVRVALEVAVSLVRGPSGLLPSHPRRRVQAWRGGRTAGPDGHGAAMHPPRHQ